MQPTKIPADHAIPHLMRGLRKHVKRYFPNSEKGYAISALIAKQSSRFDDSPYYEKRLEEARERVREAANQENPNFREIENAQSSMNHTQYLQRRHATQQDLLKVVTGHTSLVDYLSACGFCIEDTELGSATLEITQPTCISSVTGDLNLKVKAPLVVLSGTGSVSIEADPNLEALIGHTSWISRVRAPQVTQGHMYISRHNRSSVSVRHTGYSKAGQKLAVLGKGIARLWGGKRPTQELCY